MNKTDSHRGMKIIGIVLILYAVLVATHKGEFWPFSIYPMFSKAGSPWTRAIVLDVTDVPENQIWETRTLSKRLGEPVPIGHYGVDQKDLSNFIYKNDNWTFERKKAVQNMLGPENIGHARWMASKVRGHLEGNDSVIVEIQPFLLVTADTVISNPMLDKSEYPEVK